MCKIRNVTYRTVPYRVITILETFAFRPKDPVFFSTDSLGDSIDKTCLWMLARRYAATLSAASKVSSVLLKRISPDQATPFNLAGFDAPESLRGIESSFHARFANVSTLFISLLAILLWELRRFQSRATNRFNCKNGTVIICMIFILHRKFYPRSSKMRVEKSV